MTLNCLEPAWDDPFRHLKSSSEVLKVPSDNTCHSLSECSLPYFLTIHNALTLVWVILRPKGGQKTFETFENFFMLGILPWYGWVHLRNNYIYVGFYLFQRPDRNLTVVLLLGTSVPKWFQMPIMAEVNPIAKRLKRYPLKFNDETTCFWRMVSTRPKIEYEVILAIFGHFCQIEKAPSSAWL